MVEPEEMLEEGEGLEEPGEESGDQSLLLAGPGEDLLAVPDGLGERVRVAVGRGALEVQSQSWLPAELKSTWKYLKYSVCRSRTRSGWSLLLKLSMVSAVQGQSPRLVPYSEQKQLEEDWSDWTEVQDRRDSNSNHNNTCIV